MKIYQSVLRVFKNNEEIDKVTFYYSSKKKAEKEKLNALNLAMKNQETIEINIFSIKVY